MKKLSWYSRLPTITMHIKSSSDVSQFKGYQQIVKMAEAADKWEQHLEALEAAPKRKGKK